MSNRTVRQAVTERKQEVVAAQPAQVALPVLVRQVIQKQQAAFESIMPGGDNKDPERFTRQVISAVKATPLLINCFRSAQGQQSLVIAAMQVAGVGLEPNTPTQDAWILPRKNKGVTEAQLILGYRGLLKLVRRSGFVASIQAFDVREHDDFEWWYGVDADHLRFKPGAAYNRGELTHAYAIARFTNGGSNFVVLNEEEVHQRRAMSPSWSSATQRAYSPWTTWTASMWRKSALRALVPYLELQPEDARIIGADEQAQRWDPNTESIVGTGFDQTDDEGSPQDDEGDFDEELWLPVGAQEDETPADDEEAAEGELEEDTGGA